MKPYYFFVVIVTYLRFIVGTSEGGSKNSANVLPPINGPTFGWRRSDGIWINLDTNTKQGKLTELLLNQKEIQTQLQQIGADVKYIKVVVDGLKGEYGSRLLPTTVAAPSMTTTRPPNYSSDTKASIVVSTTTSAGPRRATTPPSNYIFDTDGRSNQQRGTSPLNDCRSIFYEANAIWPDNTCIKLYSRRGCSDNSKVVQTVPGVPGSEIISHASTFNYEIDGEAVRSFKSCDKGEGRKTSKGATWTVTFYSEDYFLGYHFTKTLTDEECINKPEDWLFMSAPKTEVCVEMFGDLNCTAESDEGVEAFGPGYSSNYSGIWAKSARLC